VSAAGAVLPLSSACVAGATREAISTRALHRALECQARMRVLPVLANPAIAAIEIGMKLTRSLARRRAAAGEFASKCPLTGT